MCHDWRAHVRPHAENVQFFPLPLSADMNTARAGAKREMKTCRLALCALYTYTHRRNQTNARAAENTCFRGELFTFNKGATHMLQI